MVPFILTALVLIIVIISVIAAAAAAANDPYRKSLEAEQIRDQIERPQSWRG